MKATTAASTAKTIDTVAARTSRLAGDPGSSSRSVCPPSSGRIGSRFRTLQPSVVKIVVSRTLDQSSDSTPTVHAYASSTPPMTMPTAGPATEMAIERARDIGLGGRNEVSPPSAASMMTGWAPVVRATTA